MHPVDSRSLFSTGPTMLPNNLVSIVLSILHRNYYKTFPPYNRTTEPITQPGTFPNWKSEGTTFSVSLQMCLHPSINFIFFLLVHSFSVFSEIQFDSQFSIMAKVTLSISLGIFLSLFWTGVSNLKSHYSSLTFHCSYLTFIIPRTVTTVVFLLSICIYL